MHLQTLTIDQFKTILQESFKSFLSEMKSELEQSSKEESNLVNIKVVMEKLQVTKPTIYNWINKGLIKPQKMGGKVLFDLSVILQNIKTKDYEFGRGRDYLYKTGEDQRSETKDDRKYHRINWKKMARKPLTEEEEKFYNSYKESKK
jgi:predicted DNA-binding transcriptional regulator AlpA